MTCIRPVYRICDHGVVQDIFAAISINMTKKKKGSRANKCVFIWYAKFSEDYLMFDECLNGGRTEIEWCSLQENMVLEVDHPPLKALFRQEL